MKVAENKKDSLLIDFEKYDQGILNLVKESLWADKATQMAGFRITHPTIGKAVFVLKTKGKEASSVWNGAVKLASQQVDAFGKAIKTA